MRLLSIVVKDLLCRRSRNWENPVVGIASQSLPLRLTVAFCALPFTFGGPSNLDLPPEIDRILVPS